MKKLLVFAIAILGFSAVSFGQVSASASSTATIITPIAIAQAANLNFGAIAVSPTLGGTVALPPASGTPTRTTGGGGGVTLPVVTGTVTAAAFTVTGLASSTYSISLPGDITLSGAGSTMTLGSFVSSPSATGNLGTGGSQTVYVGGTLNVSAAQPAGVYTNATGLTVTVNYN